MATENEVFGECVERMCVEVGGKMMGLGLVCPDYFRLSARCIDGAFVRLR